MELENSLGGLRVRVPGAGRIDTHFPERVLAARADVLPDTVVGDLGHEVPTARAFVAARRQGGDSERNVERALDYAYGGYVDDFLESGSVVKQQLEQWAGGRSTQSPQGAEAADVWARWRRITSCPSATAASPGDHMTCNKEEEPIHHVFLRSCGPRCGPDVCKVIAAK